jgi:hypothetical protein
MSDPEEIKAAARDAYLAGLRDGAKGAKPELTPTERIQQGFWGLAKGLIGLGLSLLMIWFGLAFIIGSCHQN